jgi:hypothetical protein
MPSVWIVFSSTPYKMGTFIRGILGARFNHVGLSLEPSLTFMSTFARRYVNAPLVGGYVRESFRRYHFRGRWADIKVCRVDLTEQQMARLTRFLLVFERRSKKSLYNLFSAAAVPLKKRVLLHDSYTCVEFVGDALAYAGVPGFRYGGYHSLENMERRLTEHIEYIGSAKYYPGNKNWGEDTFPRRQKKRTVLKDTATTLVRLGGRGLRTVCQKWFH